MGRDRCSGRFVTTSLWERATHTALLRSRLRQSGPVRIQRYPRRTGDHSIPGRSAERVQHATVRLAGIKVRIYHFRSDSVAGESAALSPTGRKNNFLESRRSSERTAEAEWWGRRQMTVTGQASNTESRDKMTKNGSQSLNGSFWTRACSHYCKVLLLILGQDGDHRSAV